MASAVIEFKPEESLEERQQQRRIAVDAFAALKQEVPSSHKSGWVGLWWNDRREEWLVGCCFYSVDLKEALVWFDAQWRAPARVFRVQQNTARLRCAKTKVVRTVYVSEEFN